MTRARAAWFLVPLAATFVAVGCGSDDDDDRPPSETGGEGGDTTATGGGDATGGEDSTGGENATGGEDAGGTGGSGEGGLPTAGEGGLAEAGSGGAGGEAEAGAGGELQAGAGGTGGADADCNAPVDLFPVPIGSGTSPFPTVDDSSLAVAFDLGFTFTFYGTVYDTVHLNTNGGLTFGAGTSAFDVSAADVSQPGIAVFWGDLDAGAGANDRANQMVYQQCANRFRVTYTMLQDNDDSTWNNTATLDLLADGTITIAYGTVGSEDILVGVFDGTHTDDQSVSVQSSYAGYTSMGTAVLLFDNWGAGTRHTGELSEQTITFSP
jgi:hypothetical protein